MSKPYTTPSVPASSPTPISSFGTGLFDHLSNILNSITSGYDTTLETVNNSIGAAGTAISPFAKQVGEFGGTLSNFGNLVTLFRPALGLKLSATGEALKGAEKAVTEGVADAQKSVSGYQRSSPTVQRQNKEKEKKKRKAKSFHKPRSRRNLNYKRR